MILENKLKIDDSSIYEGYTLYETQNIYNKEHK